MMDIKDDNNNAAEAIVTCKTCKSTTCLCQSNSICCDDTIVQIFGSSDNDSSSSEEDDDVNDIIAADDDEDEDDYFGDTAGEVSSSTTTPLVELPCSTASVILDTFDSTPVPVSQETPPSSPVSTTAAPTTTTTEPSVAQPKTSTSNSPPGKKSRKRNKKDTKCSKPKKKEKEDDKKILMASNTALRTAVINLETIVAGQVSKIEKLSTKLDEFISGQETTNEGVTAGHNSIMNFYKDQEKKCRKLVKTACVNWNRKLENLRNNINNNTESPIEPNQLCPFANEIFNLRVEVDKLDHRQAGILESINDKSDAEWSCHDVVDPPPQFGDLMDSSIASVDSYVDTTDITTQDDVIVCRMCVSSRCMCAEDLPPPPPHNDTCAICTSTCICSPQTLESNANPDRPLQRPPCSDEADWNQLHPKPPPPSDPRDNNIPKKVVNMFHTPKQLNNNNNAHRTNTSQEQQHTANVNPMDRNNIHHSNTSQRHQLQPTHSNNTHHSNTQHYYTPRNNINQMNQHNNRNNTQHTTSSNQQKQNLHRTIIFMDSNRRHLDTDTLWKGSKMVQCGNINSLLSNIKATDLKKYDIVLVHVGVNDIDSKPGTSVANDLRTAVKSIRSKAPDAKIIVSEVTPRQLNRDNEVIICNEHLHSYSIPLDFTIATHSNLRDNKFFVPKDNKHLNEEKIGVFASNLKTALRKAINFRRKTNLDTNFRRKNMDTNNITDTPRRSNDDNLKFVLSKLVSLLENHQ